MSNLIFNLLISKLSNSQLWQSKVWAKICLKTLIKSFPNFKSMYSYFQNQLWRYLHFQLAHALLPLSKKESRSPWTKFYRYFHYFTIENNALVFPHAFWYTIKQKKFNAIALTLCPNFFYIVIGNPMLRNDYFHGFFLRQ